MVKKHEGPTHEEPSPCTFEGSPMYSTTKIRLRKGLRVEGIRNKDFI